ncbi:MAG: hypothetical protein RBQ66_05715 [Candidatus Cloacimonadaceae bacterium]|jgi:hypothetical protein|nr:hypothetical protein [Candidatus Cloacimonadaceae bacterium]
MREANAPKGAYIKLDLNKIHFKVWFAVLLSLLFTAYLFYFHLPVLNLRFMGWIFALAFVLLPLWGISKLRKVLTGLYILLLVLCFILPIYSSPIFHASRYRNLITNIEENSFENMVSPIDMSRVPIIDEAFAASLAEKKLGEDFALGSRVVLGTPTIQMVQGKLYWVVPLLHNGFFKWLANINNGTPGYIMVSATNSQDIRFIREVNGKPLNIRYQRNAFFNQDLSRHMYLSGITGVAMAGDTFELDDNGEPYWTITLYSRKIGIRGNEALGLVTVHACTGDIKYYPLIQTENGFSDELIPDWVDRVQPSYFVIPQLNWWGKYVRGFWNTMFGKRDMLNTTAGYNVIYGEDGRSYYYTGMSSVGSDEGTVGFVLTNTRDKKTSLYLISGATEYAAMRSAQGKVQQFKYYATFPILVNLDGIPTYFMTLKDAAGLVKMYCFVSVSDFSLVGVGETVKSARESYQINLATSRSVNINDSRLIVSTATGSITRIASDIKDGRSYYYFSISNKPNLVFVATSNLSSYLPLSKEGDEVSLKYVDNKSIEININGFTNHSLEE